MPADPINGPIVAMGVRASAGPSLLVSTGPPSGITFPFYFTVIRSGLAHVVLEATNWVSTTITISGAAPNWTDSDVQIGDHIELRMTAEAFSEVHTAVNTLETTVARGFPRPVTFVLAVGAPATTGTDVTNWVTAEYSGTIAKCKIAAKTAPTGAALICDILKSSNGGSSFTSIWASTPSNRIQLAAGAKTGSQTSFDTTAVAENDLFRIDVAQVGSTIAGQDVAVQLLLLMHNQ